MDLEETRRYHRDRCRRLRLEYVALLGGKCKCGAEDNLHFDHINPATKSFTIGDKITKPRGEILEEIKKCQLLCASCHSDKTISDLGKSKAKGTHGTLSSFRYCKCVLCKQAKRDYMKTYKSKMKQKSAL